MERGSKPLMIAEVIVALDAHLEGPSRFEFWVFVVCTQES